MATKGKNYEWHGKEYQAKIEKGMQRNMDRAAITLVSIVRNSFGDSGVTGTISGATRSQRAANRSKPGAPPHVDTGHLKANVAWMKDVARPLVRKVGTGVGNAKSVGYAMWLEFGTKRMAARPFLRPALKKHKTKLKREITRPIA